MSQRIRANKTRRRRGFTYLWILCLGALVFVLLYKELTAVLYILATLGVTTLLVIVAAADLGRSDQSSQGPGSQPDAQSLGSGITSKVPRK